jgi:hypothetical protein
MRIGVKGILFLLLAAAPAAAQPAPSSAIGPDIADIAVARIDDLGTAIEQSAAIWLSERLAKTPPPLFPPRENGPRSAVTTDRKA